MEATFETILSGLQAWASTHWLALLLIVTIASVMYFIGRRMVKLLVRRAVKASGERHVWHERDIEKRQKTLVNLFVTMWKFVVIFTAISTV